MPTYEYACRNCGRHFEIFQAFSDDTLTICDECGGELRKVFTAPAISFKGPGFYATDHGRKAKRSEDASGDGVKPADEKTGGRRKDSTDSKGSETGSSGEQSSKAAKKEPATS